MIVVPFTHVSVNIFKNKNLKKTRNFLYAPTVVQYSMIQYLEYVFGVRSQEFG